jgi:uncharacterized membrane protein
MTQNPYATPSAAPAGPTVTEGPGPVRAEFSAIDMLKAGKDLIADQYWTFFGVAALGILIGSAAPFGIILGPMMCGMYMCYLKKARGEQVDINLLFKGFDHFKESFIATMLMVLAMVVLMIPFGVILALVMAAAGSDAALVAIGGFYLFIFLASMVIGAFTLCTYPLIADRGYKAMDALKASVAAGRMNFGPIFVLMILNLIISLVLMMFCYLPAFFFMPVSFGAFTLVYQKIFPDS